VILVVIFVISWKFARKEKPSAKWFGSVVVMLMGFSFVIFSAFFVYLRGFSSVFDALTFSDLSRYSFSIAVGYSMIDGGILEVASRRVVAKRQHHSQDEQV
jgi:phosphoglycerol transferase MdoB-like AlkP superfamily enzyme